MDDYIVLAIPKIQDQLYHVANAIMIGINDMFLPDKYDKEHAISLNKILKRKLNGKLLIMLWDLNLTETQENIPYGSLRTAIQIL